MQANQIISPQPLVKKIQIKPSFHQRTKSIGSADKENTYHVLKMPQKSQKMLHTKSQILSSPLSTAQSFINRVQLKSSPAQSPQTIKIKSPPGLKTDSQV